MLHVRIFSDAVSYGHARPIGAYFVHAGEAGGYPGERVDAECNLPAAYYT